MACGDVIWAACPRLAAAASPDPERPGARAGRSARKPRPRAAGPAACRTRPRDPGPRRPPYKRRGARTAAGLTSGGLGRYAPLRPSSLGEPAGGRPSARYAGRGEGGGVRAPGRAGLGCPGAVPSTPGSRPSRPPSFGGPSGLGASPDPSPGPCAGGQHPRPPSALCRCASRTGRTPATCPGTTCPRSCQAESASCRRTGSGKLLDWTGQNFRASVEGRRGGSATPRLTCLPRKAVGAFAWLGLWAGSLQLLPTPGHLPGVTNSRRALGVFLDLLVVNQSRALLLEWTSLDLTCFGSELDQGSTSTPPFRSRKACRLVAHAQTGRPPLERSLCQGHEAQKPPEGQRQRAGGQSGRDDQLLGVRPLSAGSPWRPGH